jgi:hypothetical protein
MRLFSTKRKEKAFSKLLIDIPVHHCYYMKYNKKPIGSCIPHNDIEEIFGVTKNLQTNLLYGKTGKFLFVARGEEMINHILKYGSVPILRHPAILIKFPLNSENLLKKRVQYFKKHDEKLISF